MSLLSNIVAEDKTNDGTLLVRSAPATSRQSPVGGAGNRLQKYWQHKEEEENKKVNEKGLNTFQCDDKDKTVCPKQQIAAT